MLGPAGIGKSRLAASSAARCRERATVLIGRCLPYGEGITFWPLAEIVRQLAGGASREPRSRSCSPTTPRAALLADRVLQAAGLEEATDRRARTSRWAVRRLFEALAPARPLVLVFEDVHWAEPPLLDLIEHLARAHRDAPLMLLCLARDELLERGRSGPAESASAEHARA